MAGGPTHHLTERVARSVFGAVVRPFQAFVQTEASSGILLFAVAVAALVWANASPDSYQQLRELALGISVAGGTVRFTLAEAVNDGLMTIFFFVVGMEIKREIRFGELNTRAKALLPAVAAVGGMVVPAAIYFALNRGGPGSSGWAIPMATDIAFTVGVLTLLKQRVPNALIVFVTALAIFDDIGGILVIALFYGDGIHLEALFELLVAVACLVFLNRARVARASLYLLAGIALWHAFHALGIHATIAGVVLGFAVPAVAPEPSRKVLTELADHVQAVARTPSDVELDAAQILMIEDRLEDIQAPLHRFVHLLHPIVAFGIMPLFALVNAGLYVRDLSPSELGAPVALGTALGLVFGKTVGVFGCTWLAVRSGLAPMPGGASAVQLLGAATTTGIGFTVALFIAGLAFTGSTLEEAKLGILVGSFAAGVLGASVLLLASRSPAKHEAGRS